jgi:hypothetical protein
VGIALTAIFLCTQARKEFLQQAARAWHSEQEVEKHSLLLVIKAGFVKFCKTTHCVIGKAVI